MIPWLRQGTLSQLGASLNANPGVMSLIRAPYHTVSHFSYAPLIKCKITQKRNIFFFYSETTSVKRIYICITHCNFIVIRSGTNEKMDPEGHYPQNTIHIALFRMKLSSHYIFFRVVFLLCQRKEPMYSWQYLRLECIC